MKCPYCHALAQIKAQHGPFSIWECKKGDVWAKINEELFEEMVQESDGEVAEVVYGRSGELNIENLILCYR